MKQLKKKLFASIIALSLFALNMNANDIENFEVTVLENSTVVKMKVNLPSSNIIDVALYNNFEREIFNKRVDVGETFESQVDFAELRRGTYTLVSTVNNMRLNKVFKVNGSEVEMIDSYITYIPLFKKEGDFLWVYYVASEKDEIGISIEDMIYTYDDRYFENNSQIFSQVYSLENLQSGDYSVNFSSKGEYYTYDFTIE